MFCHEGVDIPELLKRATERDHEDAVDYESDDERREFRPCSNRKDFPADASGFELERDYESDEERREPIMSERLTAQSSQQTLHTALKHGRSASPAPAPPSKKSKNERKHKKAHYVRVEQREREGHTPRPKVVQRNIAAGTSIKTNLDSAELPAAHGAYVAKNYAETCADTKYLPEDLDAMGFECIPWNGV